MLIFARVISSWLPTPPSGPGAVAINTLHKVTDVVLAPMRKALPALRLGNFGLDLSPLIVLLLLGALTRALC